MRISEFRFRGTAWAIPGLLLCLGMAAAEEPAPESRFALLIGNSSYATAGKLPNAVNDAQVVAEAFQAVGFTVEVLLDLDLDGMDRALDLLEAKASETDVVALYYAGHGMQHDGTNYLLPVDAELRNSRSVLRETIALDDVLEILKAAPTTLVFLDACRNNPFAERLAGQMESEKRAAAPLSSGLAVVRAPGDMMISFATLPGEVAYDGGFGNSPYARALARHVRTPDVEISVMMKRVTRDVMEETRTRQRPQQMSQMQDEFYFSMGGGALETEQDKTLLAAYPGHVTTGGEIALFADVPADCAPRFVALSPSMQMTEIPQDYFTVQSLETGQLRFEISPGTRYGLVATEQDERGVHQIGFYCAPKGRAGGQQAMAMLRDVVAGLRAGEFKGSVAGPEGEAVLYHFASVEFE